MQRHDERACDREPFFCANASNSSGRASLPRILRANWWRYKIVEDKAIERVCRPIGITGAHFYRMPFSGRRMLVAYPLRRLDGQSG